MRAQTLKSFLEDYVLYHDLAAESRDWYRRVVSVFCTWAGGDVMLEAFNGEAISRLLADKQKAGRSPHYVKSLRNALVALLNELRGNGPRERVRSVKTPPLDPEAWTPAEVERLINACEEMPESSRWRWIIAISLGYYTGLDRCDIERIERKNISPAGILVFRRRKTKSLIVVQVPPDLMDLIDKRCPPKGPVLRMGISKEWFRKIFGGIVARAGLSGTFKKLRKTSGSIVEAIDPGKGHQHLGNTQAIFEKHYEAKRLTRAEPTMPPAIRIPRPDDPPEQLFIPWPRS